MNDPIFMTLLVRDEADIVRSNIEYHLSRGIDHIFATDNLSQDGTTEILREFERLGVLSYCREDADTHNQSTWVTRMARTAHARDSQAIVIHVDADEFWWPIGASLPELLNQAFVGRDGVGEVARYNYVGPNLIDLDGPFFERCCYRQRSPVNALGLKLAGKVCHRAASDIAIAHGNHRAMSPGGPLPPRFIHGIEVLHFPNRSLQQFLHKTQRGARTLNNNPTLPQSVGRTWREVDRAVREGTFKTAFRDQIMCHKTIRDWLDQKSIIPCRKLADYMLTQQQAAEKRLAG